MTGLDTKIQFIRCKVDCKKGQSQKTDSDTDKINLWNSTLEFNLYQISFLKRKNMGVRI